MDDDTRANAHVLEDWMTPAELASELGVSIETLRKWEHQRIGPPRVKVGQKVLYRRGGVRAWLENKEAEVVRRRQGESEHGAG